MIWQDWAKRYGFKIGNSIRKICAIGVLVVIGVSWADGLLTPMFPVNDGVNDKNFHSGWQRKLEIAWDKRNPTVTYITFATEGYDLEKAHSALFHIYAQQVKRSGKLVIYRLLKPLDIYEGRCIKSHELVFDPNRPLASIDVQTKDQGELYEIDIGKPFGDGKPFYGLCLVGENGLNAVLGSMETDHPPLIMIRYAVPSLDSLDFAKKLATIEASVAKADSAAGIANDAAWNAHQSTKDAFSAMTLAQVAADSAKLYSQLSEKASQASEASAQIAMDSEKAAEESAKLSGDKAIESEGSAQKAEASALQSAIHAQAALASSQLAQESALAAGQSETAASLSAVTANHSEVAAEISKNETALSAAAALQSEVASQKSAENAHASELAVKASETTVSGFVSQAQGAATNASTSALSASNSATSATSSANSAASKLEEMKNLVIQGGIPVGFSLFSSSSQAIGGFNYTGMSLTLESAWQEKESLPASRTNGAATLEGRNIHFIGGNATNPVKAHYAYDTLTQSWNTLAQMPTVRYQHIAETVGGLIFVSGGFVNNGTTPSKNTLVYDPRKNDWDDVAPAPTGRRLSASAVWNDRIYAFGGVVNNPVATAEMYNPASNSWTTLAPMPTARQQACAAVVDGLIYVIGGKSSSANVASVEVYDPNSNNWTALRDMPTAMRAMSVAVVDGLIHIIGGQTNKAISLHQVYNPDSDTWTSLQPLPSARFNASSVVLNRSIFIMGGSEGSNSLSTVQEYSPAAVLYLMKKL